VTSFIGEVLAAKLFQSKALWRFLLSDKRSLFLFVQTHKASEILPNHNFVELNKQNVVLPAFYSICGVEQTQGAFVSTLIDINFPSEIGSLIKARRAQRDIGQEQLAAIVGISRYTLVDIETGKSDPKFSTVLKLADALGFRIALVPSDVEINTRPRDEGKAEEPVEIDLDEEEVDLEAAWKGD
jgi:DNA-binding XRE family transcriptional regulator